jgi:NADH-quinone oxidoreductase subunit A
MTNEPVAAEAILTEAIPAEVPAVRKPMFKPTFKKPANE